jgi:hypothetical protein
MHPHAYFFLIYPPGTPRGARKLSSFVADIVFFLSLGESFYARPLFPPDENFFILLFRVKGPPKPLYQLNNCLSQCTMPSDIDIV